MKRTGLAVGFQHPTWKEELNFKAVQISSDLLVGPRSPQLHLPLQHPHPAQPCRADLLCQM